MRDLLKNTSAGKGGRREETKGGKEREKGKEGGREKRMKEKDR